VSCTRSCVDADAEVEVCARTCACLADRSQEENLWSDLMRSTLTAEQENRYFELVELCRKASLK
jgi:hypothetical protein